MRRVGLRGVLCLVSLLVALSATSATAAGNRYALVIGINDYELLGKLDCARADAEALAGVLVQNCGFDPERLCLITDNPARGREFQPTFTNIQRRLQFFTTAPGDGDSLIVYFAGHGVTIGNDGYLMPADGSDDRSGIAMGWLRDRLNACNATNKVLILDACHSGKLTRGVSGIAPTLATAPSVLVLASCKENEISYPEGKHGVFTAALLEGLNGKADQNQDKSLTGAELYAFIRDYMVRWSVRTAKAQTPQMTPADAAGIQVASISPRPVAPPKPAGSAVPPPDPKLLLATLCRSVADDLVRGDVPAAVRHATEAKADAVLAGSAKEIGDLSRQIGRMSTVADQVMSAFARDKGKEVKVELRSGTENMLIETVAGRSVTAKRILRTGSGSMQAACSFGYADLSYREKAKRLALLATGADAALLQGTLALENRQTAPARKLFADSATDLGKALAARLEEAEANAAAEPRTVEAPAPAVKNEKSGTVAKTGKKEKGKPEAKKQYLPATAAVVEAAMAELKKANPDEPDLKYQYKINGDRIELDLTKNPNFHQPAGYGNTGLSDISSLAGLPIAVLVLTRSSVSDLSPLSGMPLENLNLYGTLVESLEPLRGLKLTKIGLLYTKVNDLSPLQGMPIVGLEAPPAFSDGQLPILAKMPLTRLKLSESQVSDITPLKRLSLNGFQAQDCRLLRDISALRGMPLAALDISGTAVDNLSVLKSLDQANLALNLSPRQLPALLPLKTTLIQEIMVLADGTPITDITPVTVCAKLRSLGFSRRTGNITITDLRPLAQLRELKVLFFGETVVGDVSALAECKKLEELTLPPDATNVEALRKLPNLKMIDNRPAAAFWKTFDAEKADGGGGGKR